MQFCVRSIWCIATPWFTLHFNCLRQIPTSYGLGGWETNSTGAVVLVGTWAKIGHIPPPPIVQTSLMSGESSFTQTRVSVLIYQVPTLHPWASVSFFRVLVRNLSHPYMQFCVRSIWCIATPWFTLHFNCLRQIPTSFDFVALLLNQFALSAFSWATHFELCQLHLDIMAGKMPTTRGGPFLQWYAPTCARHPMSYTPLSISWNGPKLLLLVWRCDNCLLADFTLPYFLCSNHLDKLYLLVLPLHFSRFLFPTAGRDLLVSLLPHVQG